MSTGRGRRCLVGVSLLVGSLLALAPSGVAGEESPGATVGGLVLAVAFDSPVAIDRESFRRHLPLQVGQPFEERALRESVEWLRDKEIFSKVTTHVRGEGEGVHVTFALQPADFVVGIRVLGNASIPEEEILRRARIREDEPLSEAREAAVAERVRTLYADRGYPDTVVQIERVRPRPGRIEAWIRIVEGTPVRLVEVDVVGSPQHSGDAPREVIGVEVGDVFEARLPAQARDRLVRALRAKGYYEVDVREHSDVVGREAFLVLEVRPGPRFDIVVEGNRSIDREALLGLAKLDRRPIVTDGTWRLLARRMQEEYRSRGYRFATVESTIETQGRKRVTFRVEEGSRVRVREVRFEGASAVDSETLRGAMDLLRTSTLPFGDTEAWLLEDVLAADRERIVELYRSQGFLEAKVERVRREYSEDRSRVALILVIDEGLRSRLTGVEVVDPAGLLERAKEGLSLIRGEPVSPDRIEDDRRLLASRVTAAGHPEAAVESELVADVRDELAQWVLVRYRVRPGPEVRVGRIIVKQNYFTRDRVIRRELTFGTGDRLDPAALLESQRRIYRLGLFRAVSVQAGATEGTTRDVVVRVVERPNGELQYGFGYNTRAGLRNFLQVGHRNVLGTGRPVTLRGELNLSPNRLVPDEYVLGFDAREPRVAESEFDWRSNLVFQRSEREIDEFSIRRFSLSTGFEREFLPGFQGSTMIEFEDSRVFDVAPDVLLTGQDRGRLRTVSVNPIVVYDGRDDAFAPTRGVFDTFRLRYGTPALGSEVHFAKVNAQHSQYVPLRAGWTWIYALRAGIAEPLGDSATIPLRERFFLGGRTSVRGFDENGVGPRGAQGNPLGGDLLFSGNLEVRFPLAWGAGGAAFVDGGGLYLRDRAITLRDFREAAGLGLRYQTPVGAISLDYGVKLDRRRGESIGEVHFTIGNIF